MMSGFSKCNGFNESDLQSQHSQYVKDLWSFDQTVAKLHFLPTVGA